MAAAYLTKDLKDGTVTATCDSCGSDYPYNRECPNCSISKNIYVHNCVYCGLRTPFDRQEKRISCPQCHDTPLTKRRIEVNPELLRQLEVCTDNLYFLLKHEVLKPQKHREAWLRDIRFARSKVEALRRAIERPELLRDSNENIVRDNFDNPVYKEYGALVEATKNLTDADCRAIMRGEKPYKSRTIKAVNEEIKKLEDAPKCKWHDKPLHKGKCPHYAINKLDRHPVRAVQRLSEAFRKEFGYKLSENHKVQEVLKPF